MSTKNILVIAVCFTILNCLNTQNRRAIDAVVIKELPTNPTDSLVKKTVLEPLEIVVDKDVPIGLYFKWMDSIVANQNKKNTHTLNEYLIVHNNKWIIDTLAKTDYYDLMDKGVFNYDSKTLFALKKGQVLEIPDALKTQQLTTLLQNTYLDLNIPEYKLRIIQNGKELYRFPARVGQNDKRYMAMAKRTVDMRTVPGTGKIIRVNKSPTFANPKTNHRYYVTKRDDGRITQLPVIPWLEPSINGVSHGQLIHPTTNLETLNKASSNGCIGLRESDAWYVYYYAPMDTKVVFRYELSRIDDQGETVHFEDIYPDFAKAATKKGDSLAHVICDFGKN